MKVCKSHILIVVLIAMSWSLMASQTTPSPKVKAAFEKKFPTIRKPQWKKDGNGGINASFWLIDGEVEVAYSKTGEWKSTKTELWEDTVPQKISDFLTIEYEDAYFKKGTKYEDQTGLIYRIILSLEEETEVDAPSTHLKLEFDSNGDLISEEEINPE